MLSERLQKEEARIQSYSELPPLLHIQCPTHTCVSQLSGYFKHHGYQEPNEIHYKLHGFYENDLGYDKRLSSVTDGERKPWVFLEAPQRYPTPKGSNDP